MPYSLSIYDVKETIKKVLSPGWFNNPYSEQFMYYHLNRNYFNVKDEVTKLNYVRDGLYEDNLGHRWNELSTFKNYYHMPKWGYLKSAVGIDKPYSRKFTRPDKETGLGGEFEMIIRHDGKRIDAITHEVYQETYNFGRTENSTLHFRLDVVPHKINSNYSYKKNMGKVVIYEK